MEMALEPESSATRPLQAARDEFNPYIDNGGTVVALAGPNFALLAGDTRLSEGYNIVSREEPKLFRIGEGVAMGSAGMQADRLRLYRTLRLDVAEYRQKSGRDIGVDQFARLLGNTLYYKRFQPWYTFNLVVGLDAEGHGVTYGYDAVGSTTTRRYGAAGSGEALLIGVLDQELLPRAHPTQKYCDIPKEEAMELVRKCMVAATERDIHTGDSCVILCVTKDGIEETRIPLRKD